MSSGMVYTYLGQPGADRTKSEENTMRQGLASQVSLLDNDGDDSEKYAQTSTFTRWRCAATDDTCTIWIGCYYIIGTSCSLA